MQRRYTHANTLDVTYVHTLSQTLLLRPRKSTLICWHDNWSGIFAWPRKYGCEEKMNEQRDMNKKQQHKPSDRVLSNYRPHSLCRLQITVSRCCEFAYVGNVTEI